MRRDEQVHPLEDSFTEAEAGRGRFGDTTVPARAAASAASDALATGQSWRAICGRRPV